MDMDVWKHSSYNWLSYFHWQMLLEKTSKTNKQPLQIFMAKQTHFGTLTDFLSSVI